MNDDDYLLIAITGAGNIIKTSFNVARRLAKHQLVSFLIYLNIGIVKIVFVQHKTNKNVFVICEEIILCVNQHSSSIVLHKRNFSVSKKTKCKQAKKKRILQNHCKSEGIWRNQFHKIHICSFELLKYALVKMSSITFLLHWLDFFY